MKRKSLLSLLGRALFCAIFLFPFSASAAYISVDIDRSVISSGGSFQVTMTSLGVTSCTSSRLDNGSVWQWKDVPLPGLSYDSGVVSGWAGPAEYEWRFKCKDSTGNSYFGATSLTINGAPSIPPFIAAIITAITPTPPTPVISVTPTPLTFPDTTISTPNTIHLTVANTGAPSSLLTGSVNIAGDPSFTCISGCTYTNVPPGPAPDDVVIRFEPTSVGPKTATLNFSGGGGATVPANGNGITPPIVITASPQPIISVSPYGTLPFNSVEIGDHSDKVFTVQNVGPSGTLLSGTVTLSGSSMFSCIAGCTYTNLGTTDSHPATIRFHPVGAPGTKMATVDFTGGGDATRYVNGDGYLLSITGVLDFGPVQLSKSKTLPFTISNPSTITHAGSGTLVVPPPFSCVGVCTYNLPPGGSQTFQITFTPITPTPVLVTGSLNNFPSSVLTFKGNGVRAYLKVREI